MLLSLCQLTKLQPGSGRLHPSFQSEDLIQSSAKPEEQLPLSPAFSGSGPEKRTLFRFGSLCSLMPVELVQESRRSEPAPAPLPALGCLPLKARCAWTFCRGSFTKVLQETLLKMESSHKIVI